MPLKGEGEELLVSSLSEYIDREEQSHVAREMPYLHEDEDMASITALSQKA